jgi:alkylhydroperoxidase/carboxymuconolactone decarboxylase family protein YurZ
MAINGKGAVFCCHMRFERRRIINMWLNHKEDFQVKDVRELKGNFLPSILKKAQRLEPGNGITIIQSFEPIPLYSAMAELGYVHETEKVSESEYRVYFYRERKEEPELPEGMDMPFKPTAIVNFNTINPRLADTVVNFWNYIWGNEDSAIDMKTRLLLSLANGVGAGRMRQAVREFIKAYSLGVTTEEFDEIFAMFAWNQGVGYFASEIGPSALFGAYTMVKSLEKKESDRSKIVTRLLEKFGEKNPQVNTFFAGKGEGNG